ncbi:MAG: prepilin-type N-terminal cleavage/methylation domain-containing protein [Myxococcales bacterium]|nr:prepilin-type N-terminal cleavage/methylation domain-containing protein [Myxococcales bacterium]MDH5308271.1 prepilin-type N-terminal cleavage/methylation domain-containing protein [Myxococcales bacterium]MDH5567106.1 prepilin-type N-terminal cleavage/methylation domain-containing protein [Myxococcales bacterium]
MSSSEMCVRTGHVRSGFTLLEVLAAVLILGMLYTVLAGVAIEGLRAEGQNRRRLEASLLADQRMAEMESGFTTEGAPPIGHREEERDLYVVETDVRGLDVNSLLPPAALAGGSFESWILNNEANEPRLREIRIAVTWPEGDVQLSVVRTTFAFDTADLATSLASSPDTAGELDAAGTAATTGRGAGGKAGSLEQMLERQERRDPSRRNFR